MKHFANRTRVSASIPRRLIREGKLHLLPVYYLGRLSRTGREVIDGGGSYRLADHIYAGEPRGTTVLGRLIDAAFLRMPSARSFRMRYRAARRELEDVTDRRLAADRDTAVLAVPCGLARELFDLAERCPSRPGVEARVHLSGVDLDSGLIDELDARARQRGLTMRFRCADALTEEAFTGAPYDAIVGLGFTEFLADEEVIRYYRLVRDALAEDGVFISSGFRRHALSDHLLRNVGELFTHYRGASELTSLAEAAGFRSTRTYGDPTGLLTMLVAGRG